MSFTHWWRAWWRRARRYDSKEQIVLVLDCSIGMTYEKPNSYGITHVMS
jgi:hypothetical protein